MFQSFTRECAEGNGKRFFLKKHMDEEVKVRLESEMKFYMIKEGDIGYAVWSQLTIYVGPWYGFKSLVRKKVKLYF